MGQSYATRGFRTLRPSDGIDMRVLVIGGAGFIGSHLVDRLLAEDHEVDVADDLSTGSLANLSDARAVGGSLKIHHLDARSADFDTLIGMRRPEVVYLLAALPRPSAGAVAATIGLELAAVALEGARRHGVGKVVVALPATALYGHPSASALPVKEGAIAPGSSGGGVSGGLSRGVKGVVGHAVIDLLETYRDAHSIEFTVAALASVYGPRQRPDGGVASAFRAAVKSAQPPVIHGDGRQTRDFVFIDDVVDALVRSADRGGGLVINVGTGVQTTVRELWERIGAGSGLAAIAGPARPDDLARFAVSPVRARIHLAWSSWTSLDDGVERLRTST
jgi:UDP-glucose 4-epimerase